MHASSLPRSLRRLFGSAGGALALAACANSTFDPDETSPAQGGSAGQSAGVSGKNGAGKGGTTAGAGGEAGTPVGKGGTAGSAGTGGSSGKGGASGKGGTGGKGVAGGDAGDGGVGGASGKGGGAGTGGKGGAAGKAGASGAAGKAGSASGQAGTAGVAGSAQGGAPPSCVYAPDEDAAKDDACFSCWNETVAAESCQVERAACDADPSCAETFQCVVACPGEDSSCEKKCTSEKGKPLYEGLRDCIVGGACKDLCKDHVSEALSLDMCKHDVCTVGMILYRDCSPEADAICEQDATCCGGFDPEWGNGCVAKAEKAGYCPEPGCVHAPCAPGAPILNKSCSPCVSAICDQFPICCSPLGKWDPACANAVATVCKDL